MPSIADFKTHPVKLFGILNTTLVRARTVSDRRKADAEARIGPITANGLALAADIATAHRMLTESTAQLGTSIRGAYIDAGMWLDRCFNQAGRVRHNAAYKLAVGGGLTFLKRGPVAQLALRLRTMADSFERSPPTGTSLAEGLAIATGLRAHADVIATQTSAVQTAKQHLALLTKTYRTQARLGQRALASLKLFWLSMDFTPAQVHEIIPDNGPRPRSSGKDAVASAPPVHLASGPATPVMAVAATS